MNERINNIEINQIIKEIDNPINDLYNIEIIKNRISKSSLEKSIKVKIRLNEKNINSIRNYNINNHRLS